jgi:23S rRNA pseudouridine2605 synthase
MRQRDPGSGRGGGRRGAEGNRDPNAGFGPRGGAAGAVGAAGGRHGLARVLSKVGFCSRAEATRLIGAGEVAVNGVVCRDPERPTDATRDRIAVRGENVRAPEAWEYVMLNKPRGLVTTTADERGRGTVFECLAAAELRLPRLVAVGRLDQASEGLLLFTNDTAWAARLTDPASHVPKTYHVQVDTVADAALCRRVEAGVIEGGERLTAREVRVLRVGEKNAWLEVVLDEGRNRHLRRLFAGFGLDVLRLVRVRIGSLALGDLPKGGVRRLLAEEVAGLAGR